ncbi:hypothetical protein KBX34_29230 [Micromonospora sp. M61]|nr:hypothetical protein [Micromonospora sp. M61]
MASARPSACRLLSGGFLAGDLPSRGLPSRGLPSRGLPSRGLPSGGPLSAGLSRVSPGASAGSPGNADPAHGSLAAPFPHDRAPHSVIT